MTLQQAALPATYDFVQAVLGQEQAQEEEDMLDDFLLHNNARGEEEEEEDADSASELAAGEEEDDDSAKMDAEEAAFVEAQLTDERRATLRWLRRLKGHVVQYPAGFLSEDLQALRPVNGLEGWVL